MRRVRSTGYAARQQNHKRRHVARPELDAVFTISMAECTLSAVVKGRLLMPLAAGSILGGMTTLIGTPPNLIVAGYRHEVLSDAFGVFTLAPVGRCQFVLNLIVFIYPLLAELFFSYQVFSFRLYGVGNRWQSYH